MASFYTLEVPEMMRKIFIDYHVNVYRKDSLGYFGGINTTGKNVGRKNAKESIEDIIGKVQTAPPEEAMQVLRDIGFITPKHEEDAGCTYVIAGDDEKRDLWMIYGPESKTSCYGSFVMLASDLRKHIKNNK